MAPVTADNVPWRAVAARFRYALAAAGLAAALGACTSGHPASAPPATTTSTTSTTSIPTPDTSNSTTSTTATWHPTAPQSTPDAAASLLVADWSAGERPAATNVAAPAAVAALFAAPYPGGSLALDRGCGDTPVVCTFGPNGGADPNDAIYEIYVTQTAGGWYVSSVMVES